MPEKGCSLKTNPSGRSCAAIPLRKIASHYHSGNFIQFIYGNSNTLLLVSIYFEVPAHRVKGLLIFNDLNFSSISFLSNSSYFNTMTYVA